MYESKKLKEDRQVLVEQLRSIDGKVQERGEDEDYSAEERQEFDRVQADVKSLDEKIETAVRRESIPAPQERTREESDRIVERRLDSAGLSRRERDLAVAGWLLRGRAAQTERHRAAMSAAGLNDHGAEMVLRLAGEQPGKEYLERAHNTGVDVKGGFTVDELARGPIERKLYEFSGGLRSYATVVRTATGADYPIPTIEDTGTAVDHTELGAVADGDDLTFGESKIGCGTIHSGVAKISLELLQDSSLNMDREIGNALSERIARKVAAHHVQDTAAPWEGLLDGATENAAGIDVEVPTYDDFLGLYHSVPQAYRASRSCAWAFSDSVLMRARLVKDGNGRPIWQPGMIAGEPDRLFSKPIVYMPDAGDDDLVFGDLSKFYIREVRDVVLRRLDEKYITSLAVGFIAYYRGGSKVVTAEPNALVKAAAPVAA